MKDKTPQPWLDPHAVKILFEALGKSGSRMFRRDARYRVPAPVHKLCVPGPGYRVQQVCLVKVELRVVYLRTFGSDVMILYVRHTHTNKF